LPGSAWSAEYAKKVSGVSLPLCARADHLKAKSVVDREHGRIGDGVLRPHPRSFRPLSPDPFEHRRLCPFGEPEPAVRRVDARVLLMDEGWIPRLECAFRAADARPGVVTTEHRPSGPARLDEGPVKLGDERGVDGHVTEVEIFPRSGLHDAVKRCRVGAEVV